MDALLKGLPIFMMIGIVVVIGISQFNRLLGGVLGIVFWALVAIVGGSAYDQGGGIGLLGLKFTREVFYALAMFFILTQVLMTYTAWKRRQRHRGRSVEEEDAR